MSSERFPIEVWIVMNASGAYIVGADEDEASSRADEEWSEDVMRRYVKLEIQLAPPNDDVVSFRTFSIAESEQL